DLAVGPPSLNYPGY
nr:Chain C, TEX-14 [Homo sapiens]3WUU_F Chain F, TEX-14 [Homo sapiens]3WUU_I Chain I, TEX-14 [Homo sapiens]3WUU_L Chain L, TEX-14 [Homo sapiens]